MPSTGSSCDENDRPKASVREREEGRGGEEETEREEERERLEERGGDEGA